ncbi:unnamed protein product [Ostreobium quekettii]|uniref:Uncharacterized protein n=1 Tax=Ostreobium quekettii TaxID=121088 RepID=A0A8S1J402_9CHLO|nr:unnamed protein product [Ostreobium quekettii]
MVAAERGHGGVVEELVARGARREGVVRALSASPLEAHKRMARLLSEMDAEGAVRSRAAQAKGSGPKGGGGGEAQTAPPAEERMSSGASEPDGASGGDASDQGGAGTDEADGGPAANAAVETAWGAGTAKVVSGGGLGAMDKPSVDVSDPDEGLAANGAGKRTTDGGGSKLERRVPGKGGSMGCAATAKGDEAMCNGSAASGACGPGVFGESVTAEPAPNARSPDGPSSNQVAAENGVAREWEQSASGEDRDISRLTSSANSTHHGARTKGGRDQDERPILGNGVKPEGRRGIGALTGYDMKGKSPQRQSSQRASSGWMNGTWREKGLPEEPRQSNGKCGPTDGLAKNGRHRAEVEALEAQFSTLRTFWDATKPCQGKQALEPEVSK